MKIDAHSSIARVATEVPGAIGVFEALGIDYACAGERSLEDAAYAEGLDPDVLLGGLRRLPGVDRVVSWADRPLVELTHFLTEQHHLFVRQEMATLALSLADICSRVDPPAELLSLRAAFAALAATVLPHLQREERHVFRAVEAAERAWESNAPLDSGRGELAADVRQMVIEHGVISAQLRTMRELRLTITATSELPVQTKSALEAMATLERHLHEFMFLENSVLFPRASALETRGPVTSHPR